MFQYFVKQIKVFFLSLLCVAVDDISVIIICDGKKLYGHLEAGLIYCRIPSHISFTYRRGSGGG